MKAEPKPRIATAVVWTLRLWLLALAAYSLLIKPIYTTRFLLVTSALAGLAVSLGFAFIPTKRPRTLLAAESLVLFAFIMHVMGHAVGLYARISFYDKILHTVAPAAIAYALYALSQSTSWIWEWTKVKPLETTLYLFCIMVTLGVVWEVFEFATDSLVGTHEQGGNTDTMLDLVADASGALVGAIVAGSLTAYGRKHGFQSVAETRQRLSRRLGKRPRGA